MLKFSSYNAENLTLLLLSSKFQETPGSTSFMNTAMLKTPGADGLMFQTPDRPDSAAYPGRMTTGKKPGSVTFQFPESTEQTFRQGMGTNVSLSTWGSDFSPTAYPTYGPLTPAPGQVRYNHSIYLVFKLTGRNI